MKFKSALVTQASGSIGGLQAPTIRAVFISAAEPSRSTRRPPSRRRSAIRWRPSPEVVERVTPLQRAGWANYAASVPVTNALGSEIFLSGNAWYMATNALRLQQPLEHHRRPANNPQPSDPDPAWHHQHYRQHRHRHRHVQQRRCVGHRRNSALTMWGSRPVSAGVNYFNGPYRYVGRIAGAATPPTSPPKHAGMAFPPHGWPRRCSATSEPSTSAQTTAKQRNSHFSVTTI